LRAAADKFVAKLVFRAYRFVWATTPSVAEELASRWRIDRQRVVIQPNLVDLRDLSCVAALRRARDFGCPLRLLIVTRLDAIKGVDVAIRALAELTQERAVLRILGQGDEHYVEHLHHLARRMGVSDRIEWGGMVPRDRLPEEYENADMLLVPSRYETFGVVIVEAMAAGLPVIASNVGGIPDVVKGGCCARLVQADNPAALARAIRELSENPEEVARLRDEGERRARDFEADAGVARWLELYRASTSAAATPLKLRDTVSEQP
jgi:D-inositol-3-phosphate glycosyltransferase